MNLSVFLFLYSLYIFMTNAAKFISRSGTIMFYCIVLYYEFVNLILRIKLIPLLDSDFAY